MIKEAQLYRDELNRLFIKTWYDKKYQYFYDGFGRSEWQIPDNCYYERQFVSVNEYGRILGYIAYSYDQNSKSARDFGIICFDEFSPEYAYDVLLVIYDIFFKFGLNRVEFRCFSDNPVRKSYRSWIKRYGGREVCNLRQTTLLMDGNLHDSTIFEVLTDDLTISKTSLKTQLEEDAEKIIERRNLKNDSI